MIRFFKLSISLFGLCLLLALTAATRCSNRADVLIGDRIYFVDADCYARMTRVRMVLEHPATILKHHDFENYPQGITSHTTAPFDYLIAALKKILDAGFLISGKNASPWASQTLDLAGALVSPLLGILGAVFLWFWARRLRLPYRGMLLTLYAVSPILAHGTILGRPDHQSLLIFLMTVALGAEWALAGAPSRNWAVAAGAAWGLGLWVSLYEPLILLVLVAALNLAFGFRRFFNRARGIEFGIASGIFALSVCIEGWRVSVPDPAILRYFPNWERTIGELAGLAPLSPVLFRWTGLLLLAAPVLLALRARSEKRAIPLLLFTAATYALTLWQMRWGYFFALAFAMSLPVMMQAVRWRFVAWTLFILSLWPVAREWDDRLFPEGAARARIEEARSDKVLLRDAAEYLKSEKSLPILAPWWFSPPLVYWSGQPAVAGSSHESLPGIVDTARFYLADNPGAAQAILQARKVARVVTYDPDRVSQTASLLLGLPVPESAMIRILHQRPHSSPAFLKPVYYNPAFRIFSVEPENGF